MTNEVLINTEGGHIRTKGGSIDMAYQPPVGDAMAGEINNCSALTGINQGPLYIPGVTDGDNHVTVDFEGRELRADDGVTRMLGYQSTGDGLHILQLPAAPASPTEGATYYDTTLHKTRTFDGANWQNHW